MVSVLYQVGRDSFPFPATFSSEAIPVASVSGDSDQGQTHSGLSQCDGKSTREWSLHPEIAMMIFEIWGFPSGHVYHSPQHSCPQALVVDALSQIWQRWSMYNFSQCPVLSKVIQKLRAKSQQIPCTTTAGFTCSLAPRIRN